MKSPLETLKARLASGEIDLEEYKALKAVIGEDPPMQEGVMPEPESPSVWKFWLIEGTPAWRFWTTYEYVLMSATAVLFLALVMPWQEITIEGQSYVFNVFSQDLGGALMPVFYVGLLWLPMLAARLFYRHRLHYLVTGPTFVLACFWALALIYGMGDL